jgi:hypothetical protein
MIRHIALNISGLRALSSRTAGVRILFCVLLLMAAGCVHRTKSIPHKVVINQSFETAWPAIVKTARELNPDAVADMTTGTVATGDVLATEKFHVEDYARPPWRFFPSWTDTRFSATFTGRENNAGQTEVTLRCDFYRFDSDSGRWAVWYSLGRLEPSLLAQLEGKQRVEAIHAESK